MGRYDVAFDATTSNTAPLAPDQIRDTDGHGTAMASLVAGRLMGAERDVNARFVSIRVIDDDDPQPLWTAMRAYEIILSRVTQRDRTVVSMSFQIYSADMVGLEGQPAEDPWKVLIDWSNNAGVVVVCAAGNDGEDNTPVYLHSPRKFGGFFNNLIVVGNAMHDGTRNPSSQYLDSTGTDIVTAYALGTQVLVAWYEGDFGYTVIDGTSPATATTAGLISSWLSRGATTAQEVKTFLLATSESRKGLVWPEEDGRIIARLATDIEVPCDELSDNSDIFYPPYQPNGAGVVPASVIMSSLPLASITDNDLVGLFHRPKAFS